MHINESTSRERERGRNQEELSRMANIRGGEKRYLPIETAVVGAGARFALAFFWL